MTDFFDLSVPQPFDPTKGATEEELRLRIRELQWHITLISKQSEIEIQPNTTKGD